MEYGADQFAMNWLFNPEIDSAEAHLWNVVGADAFQCDRIWCTRRSGGLERLIGLHVVGMTRGERNRLFRNMHKELFTQELRAAGLAAVPGVCLQRWDLAGTPKCGMHLGLSSRRAGSTGVQPSRWASERRRRPSQTSAARAWWPSRMETTTIGTG